MLILRYLLRKRREDKMKAPADRRIPEGYHGKLVPTDIAILLNLVLILFAMCSKTS